MNKKFLNLGIITLSVMSGFVFTRLDSFAESTQPITQTAPIAQQQASQKVVNPSPNTIQTNESLSPKSIPEKNMDQLKNIGRNTPKNRFFKFVIAMLGVAFSILAIYGGLRLYKNISNKKNVFIIDPNDERSLESPKDFKSAINIFLNKTDI